MVLNKNIHEFDHLEKKQSLFEKLHDWLFDDEQNEVERLLQELDYWKIRCGRFERLYKNLLRSEKDVKQKKRR